MLWRRCADRYDNVLVVEWEAMKEAQRIDESSTREESSLWEPRYRDPLIAGIGLVLLQRGPEQPTVLSYATLIFKKAGFSDWSSIVMAVFKLVVTLWAASSVEHYGRKNLL